MMTTATPYPLSCLNQITTTMCSLILHAVVHLPVEAQCANVLLQFVSLDVVLQV